MKTKLRNQKGFTIIEVLIVLAIAGLILLIVFLAVPALQRNSRNTTAKNDVASALGGVSEYLGANNGTLPTTITTTAGVVSYGAGNTTTANVQGTTTVSRSAVAPAVAAPAIGTVVISIGFRCDGTASSRAYAALYSIEATSGAIRQCQDS